MVNGYCDSKPTCSRRESRARVDSLSIDVSVQTKRDSIS